MPGQLDLFVPGVVYLDVIFTGLRELPGPGTEVWAPGMGSCPGGVANLAVAASRLGLHTGLGTALSTDAYGEFCHQVLSRQEGIDLSASKRVSDWHSPVTVSVAYDRDRSMITHGHPLPTEPDGLVNGLPAARSAAVSLAGSGMGWVHRAKAEGMLVFADVGWDETEEWSPDVLATLTDCHAFLPNSVEAMRYTRTDEPRQALDKLSGLAPVVVVTCGGDGAIATDATTGEVASVPAVPVEALDPTGAGDVFTAGFITGTLGGWPLADRLAFANLVAALSVQHFGGSLSAPGWGDIADWWAGVRAAGSRGHDDSAEAELARRFGFLDDVIPPGRRDAVHRATATIARLSDARAEH
ncbi:sugar/nucleoside kinase (ribokinase family) [Actinoplanes lutulentus]|uniref:Sugar/nucleoside kinase (Ribokinase family) n=1 Tax=Actinoplanes lutulentus TaxID=1287878 RepID=A0A327ZPJ4_9ACTN|nr:PfkB family carbohydrate kinase [Actinoplanes lutulentus]MBB2944189.1 sugar/nucleoside kinase (ribokinase family) [Actinoplanes lutulentus]RAK42578.1 sugar/nucleoside kinase (ribokinase family) [Actinoplanes lutulentus]